MDRQVHRVYEMIALRAGSRVLAVTQTDFNTLAKRALPELNSLEMANYLMTLSMVGTCSREYLPMIPKWDSNLIYAVQSQISEFSDLLGFRVSASDAQRYLADILETYRGNHLGEFSWAADEQLGASNKSVAITVEIFEAPTFMDRLTKRERQPKNRHLFLASSVRAATGTSMRFVLDCGSFNLSFLPDGSVIRS